MGWLKPFGPWADTPSTNHHERGGVHAEDQGDGVRSSPVFADVDRRSGRGQVKLERPELAHKVGSQNGKAGHWRMAVQRPASRAVLDADALNVLQALGEAQTWTSTERLAGASIGWPLRSVLLSLCRRGLVEHDEDVQLVKRCWRITPVGREALAGVT